MATSTSLIYDFDPNKLPDDLLRAVGLMVTAASQTESIVQEFIGAILGIDQAEVPALTAQKSAPLKGQVARALMELNASSAEMVDIVDELLEAIDAAMVKRNEVVHNTFARHPETGDILSIREKARGSLQVTMTPVTAQEIMQGANAVYKAGMDFMQFMIFYKLRPSERTRPLLAPLDRGKKARKARRAFAYGAPSSD